MRVAILSYSHHGRGIGNVVRGLGHEIVAVMDAEEGPRGQLIDQFSCPGYEAAGECLDRSKVDVALVAGKHIEMPAHIMACVDRRIPYLLDKPFADCAERLQPVAEATVKHGVYSALTLPNRRSRIVATIKELVANGQLGDIVLIASRLNNGPPSRYDATPSYWHNQASISGGGSWAVEAAHGIDTFLQFTEGQQVTVAGAVICNTLHRRSVEDVAIALLRTDQGITGLVESGYCYPAGARSGDHFFRFVGSKASVFAQYGPKAEPLIEVHTAEGVQIGEDLSHGDRMRLVVESALAALAAGEAFEVGITDAVRILQIQDAVYAHARADKVTAGPHAMAGAAARPYLDEGPEVMGSGGDGSGFTK